MLMRFLVTADLFLTVTNQKRGVRPAGIGPLKSGKMSVMLIWML